MWNLKFLQRRNLVVFYFVLNQIKFYLRQYKYEGLLWKFYLRGWKFTLRTYQKILNIFQICVYLFNIEKFYLKVREKQWVYYLWFQVKPMFFKLRKGKRRYVFTQDRNDLKKGGDLN